MKVEAVSLDGAFVCLVPLSLEHHGELCEVGLDDDLWRLNPIQVTNGEEMKVYIETALNEQIQGRSLPFAVVEKSSNKVIGSTRFGNISIRDRRVEIGWTWICRDWQRTFVNTAAKLLMLEHAFEVWNCNRVEFKTDLLNQRSRNAIIRLGAKQEGIFRAHIICQSGRVRDSVYFSIINSEWAEIKARLENRLKMN